MGSCHLAVPLDEGLPRAHPCHWEGSYSPKSTYCQPSVGPNYTSLLLHPCVLLSTIIDTEQLATVSHLIPYK